jgi:transcriptional regulator with PAS, ATPase and Fis domain
MKNFLISWIGRTDLNAITDSATIGLGPIAQAMQSITYDRLILLSDFPQKDIEPYLVWLGQLKDTPVEMFPAKLSNPTHFSDIYHQAVAAITRTRTMYGQNMALTYHLSPGTPAMAAVWILLAKTIHPATLIQSSREQGVVVADIPFDISVEFIPAADARLQQLVAALPPEAPEFDDIIHRSPQMQRLIARARLASVRSAPVLIEGESGSGKELLARAIHRASPRSGRPFIAVNCGAIPAELVESEFFGHKKGSFTGAISDRKGYFEAAHEGTLFLDEIGELPLSAQVKILRVVQEGEVTRIGDSKPVAVDVRIVAATNRSLIQEVAAGRFRADLFYRLAVAVLEIPPLRERQGDIGLLVDHFFAQEMAVGSATSKKISTAARNLLLCHPWPGNVRELLNTLRRVAVWSTGDTIHADDVREALFPVTLQTSEHVMNRSVTDGFNIQEVMAEVARHYLQRGMEECGGNKSKAAKLLGLPNYQTLTNWLKKYGLE